MALKHVPYYMRSAFNESLTPLVRQARTALKSMDYDTLVGIGLSGALVVPTFGRQLHKNWLIVRKPDDGSHDGGRMVGTLGHQYIFVDDFTDTGATFDGVRDVIRKESSDWLDYSTGHVAKFKPECVGMYEYETNIFRPWHEPPRTSRKRSNAKFVFVDEPSNAFSDIWH